jgi:hypothetical protein
MDEVPTKQLSAPTNLCYWSASEAKSSDVCRCQIVPHCEFTTDVVLRLERKDFGFSCLHLLDGRRIPFSARSIVVVSFAGAVEMRRFVILAVCLVVVFAAEGTNKDEWRDSPQTTRLWNVIMSGNTAELQEILESDDTAAKARSADGRGPLWWAHEYGQPDMVKLLVAAGSDPNDRDGDGKRPAEVTNVGPTEYANQWQGEEQAEPVGGPADEDEDDE